MTEGEPFRLWEWLHFEIQKIRQSAVAPITLEADDMFRKHRRIANKLFKAGFELAAKHELDIALEYLKGERH